MAQVRFGQNDRLIASDWCSLLNPKAASRPGHLIARTAANRVESPSVGTVSAPDREYCDVCLPAFKDERTERLVSAARDVLARMRASSDDPARSSEAIAKRVATNAERRRSALAWEQRNPGPHDPESFRREVLPGLQTATLPQMMRATGLSSGYCWRIRRGDRVPHPYVLEQSAGRRRGMNERQGRSQGESLGGRV